MPIITKIFKLQKCILSSQVLKEKFNKKIESSHHSITLFLKCHRVSRQQFRALVSEGDRAFGRCHRSEWAAKIVGFSPLEFVPKRSSIIYNVCVVNGVLRGSADFYAQKIALPMTMRTNTMDN
jgi:hypothetical protein